MEFVEIPWQSALYQQALSLRDRLLRRPLGLSFSDEQLALEETQIHFGLRQGEQLIACVVAVLLAEDRAKLRQMAVDEAWQSQGLGRCLIEQTEMCLMNRGVRSLELHAREPVIGFYETLGYRPEGDVFMEVTIPHQKMVKSLDSEG